MKRLALFLLATSCAAPPRAVEEHNLPIMPKQDSQSLAKNRVSHLLYMIQSGKVEEAIDVLLTMRQDDPYLLHDDTLEKLGLALLEQGSKSRSPEDLVTCLYGVGISQDERSLHIAEKALAFDDPQLQLVAVSVIASFDTDHACELLERAMKSNYIFVRLESAYWLALKRSRNAHGQLVSLMSKLDPELHELFGRLYAMDASPGSLVELKKLLYDQNERVRKEAILAIAHTGRDDFIEDIRLLAKEPAVMQQEAAVFALGVFRDEASRPLLERLSASPTIRLAALKALYALGSDRALSEIIQEAARGNLFAIRLLGELDCDENVLASLISHKDINIRVNAALALLDRRDSRALDGLADVLLDTHADYTFQPIQSHGGSLSAWKVTSSSSQALEKNPELFEISLRMREQVLMATVELSEDDFFEVAEAIFTCNQYDLVPLTVRLLENLRSERAIQLLKRQEQRLGAPYIRAWCCLGLYRMHQDGPYAESVRKFVEKYDDKEIFKARPVLPWKLRQDETRYQLTLAESCALLIESYEALAMHQDQKGMEVLLKSIRNGNKSNRYTLAGLLMRSSV
ncbi:MAG: HEAT repeat domain-containing protein [Verrucomicrobia bacterium]|nr:HEAT repeat domain-containing protein [Verrucomicrobiota bacterium]MBS0636507.1 HEAT repeat domain-containing protein [Verrucomicrobiota bacterium]